MIKGRFLYRIALHGVYVSVRSVKLSVAIESNLANALEAGSNRAAVSACQAAQAALVHGLQKLGRPA